MNYLLIPSLYAAILSLDWLSARKHITTKEKRLYLLFGVLAFFSAFPAAYWEQLDHAGASLSGMLSLFIS